MLDSTYVYIGLNEFRNRAREKYFIIYFDMKKQFSIRVINFLTAFGVTCSVTRRDSITRVKSNCSFWKFNCDRSRIINVVRGKSNNQII